jgi:hypothetical protein
MPICLIVLAFQTGHLLFFILPFTSLDPQVTTSLNDGPAKKRNQNRFTEKQNDDYEGRKRTSTTIEKR